jgi:CRP-like cAMP-binding protein
MKNARLHKHPSGPEADPAQHAPPQAGGSRTTGKADSGPGNRLLAALPRRERGLLAPDLEEVRLVRGQVLFEPGRVPSHVHFPHAGTMISLVLPLHEGGETETVTVGIEGAAGIGVDPTETTIESFLRGMVQMPGAAARVPAKRLAEAAGASPVLRRLLSRHAEAAMSMALQSVACNAAHRQPARLARWLLVALDRAAPEDGGRLPLTQEFLAMMLGVRRATVGDALLAFQARGLVRLHRGGVTVLDRERLGRTACECYDAVRRRYAALLPGTTRA